MDTHMALLNGFTQNNTNKIEILPLDYKQVVFCQSADGSWNETLLKFMTHVKTYAQFITT
jgi:hypothetical protein